MPICTEQSNADSQVVETRTQMREAASYERSNMRMKAGWATMPGSSDPNRNVANACMAKLAEQF